ncbi:MAG: 1,4-dihydroxy-2-naphthoate polyprenyltransferase, partial [Spartobacteria bacterium]
MSATLKAWVLASRPKTLFAAVAPVLLGSALAFSQSQGNLPTALAALLGAVCIQIATNLANDYWDAKKGADTDERLGPVRVTASGLLKPRTVFAGMIVFFLIATAAGIFLTLRAGWPVVAIGLASILFGILYTAGPYSLAYLGLGEVFTFLFFGLVATAGTYFVQTLNFSPEAVWLGILPGSYSVVLIALNNLRDRETDQRANKKTLAVRFGERFARVEILLFLFLPSLVPLF